MEAGTTFVVEFVNFGAALLEAAQIWFALFEFVSIVTQRAQLIDEFGPSDFVLVVVSCEVVTQKTLSIGKASKARQAFLNP
jgi:hypothetical protein